MIAYEHSQIYFINKQKLTLMKLQACRREKYSHNNINLMTMLSCVVLEKKINERRFPSQSNPWNRENQGGPLPPSNHLTPVRH